MAVKHLKLMKLTNQEYAEMACGNNPKEVDKKLYAMEQFEDNKWWIYDERYEKGAQQIFYHQINNPTQMLVSKTRLILAMESALTEEEIESIIGDKELDFKAIKENLFDFQELADKKFTKVAGLDEYDPNFDPTKEPVPAEKAYDINADNTDDTAHIYHKDLDNPKEQDELDEILDNMTEEELIYKPDNN